MSGPGANVERKASPAMRLAVAWTAPLWVGVVAGVIESARLAKWMAATSSTLWLIACSLFFGILLAAAASLLLLPLRKGLHRAAQSTLEKHGLVFSLAALVAGAGVGGQLVLSLSLFFLRAGFHNLVLAAWLFTLLVVVIVAVAICAATFTLAGLGWLSARHARAARSLGVAIPLVGLAIGAFGFHRATARVIDLLPWSALIGGLVFALAIVAASFAERLASRRAVQIACLVPVIAGAALSVPVLRYLRHAPVLRATLVEHGVAAPLLMRSVASGADHDGDGHTSGLGGDCDDDNSAIHPTALEVLGNDVDEDCDGVALREDPTIGTLTGKLSGPECASDFALPATTNVIVIVLDAVRADRIKGYERDTAPNLRKLADSSVWFDRCYTPHPQTGFAVPAMFTGMQTRWARDVMKSIFVTIPPERQMVHELLRRRGHGTAALYGHSNAGPDHAVTRGFESTREFKTATNSAQIVDDAIQRIRSFQQQAKSFYLYLHFYDPHWAYQAHPAEFAPWGNQRKVDRYDGEIRFTDHHIGRLIAELGALGLRDSTVLLVVADHGEEFGEHGGEFHGKKVYEESIHVPCILSAPRIAPRVVSQPVMLMDFHPTLLDLIGLNPPSPVQAKSLEPLLLGKNCNRGPIVGEMQPFQRTNKPWNIFMIDGQHKLIWNPSDNSFVLYDLARDPGETINLIEREPELFAELRQKLRHEIVSRIMLPEGSEARRKLEFGPLPPGTRRE